jgi:hypothetical protein
MWSITSNSALLRNGSFQPSSGGRTIRCAEDEIGRNSVRPCTIPMTTASMSRSISQRRSATVAAAASG